MKTILNENMPIENVKDEISSHIGKEITIKEYNKQGRMINEYMGVVVDTYSSLFLVNVSVNNYHINKSFSYVNFSIGDMVYNFTE